MPYYVALAAIGSLAGCIWLYLLAKKGGEAYFHRHGGKASLKAREWVDRNAFLAVFVPGILPPPFPFKVFVLAAGVFQVPLRTFILALLLARGLHYSIEGILAVHYGNAVLFFLTTHKIAFILGVFGILEFSTASRTGSSAATRTRPPDFTRLVGRGSHDKAWDFRCRGGL